MVYRVELTARAERDLADLFLTINAYDSGAAFDWWTGLKASIESLENNPQRCALTPESRLLRQLLYGKNPHVYRVIYKLIEKQRLVRVLHVRHGARRAVNPQAMT